MGVKILLVSTNADEAGAPRHVESIVNGLGHLFDFIMVFGEKGPVSSRLIDRGHTVHIIDAMRNSISPFKDIVALIRVFMLVSRYDPDIIHCHSAKAGMLGRLAAMLHGKRWIYTVHGWGWRGLSKPKAAIIIIIERLLSRIRFGKYIYVAADVMKNGIEVIGLNEKIGVVIQNGTAEFNSVPPPRNAPYTIMMPARLSPAKDHKSLVMAFERLNCDNARLILCGGGTNTDNFVEKCKRLAPNRFENITFLGQSSDMAEIYSKCHVVALVSNFEALPLSLIEALSCEKAIVATNIGGIPEIITDGVDGVLVNPGAIDEICQAFHAFKDEEMRLSFGVKARDTFNRRFNQNLMLSSIGSVYKEHLSVGTE